MSAVEVSKIRKGINEIKEHVEETRSQYSKDNVESKDKAEETRAQYSKDQVKAYLSQANEERFEKIQEQVRQCIALRKAEALGEAQDELMPALNELLSYCDHLKQVSRQGHDTPESVWARLVKFTLLLAKVIALRLKLFLLNERDASNPLLMQALHVLHNEGMQFVKDSFSLLGHKLTSGPLIEKPLDLPENVDTYVTCAADGNITIAKSTDSESMQGIIEVGTELWLERHDWTKKNGNNYFSDKEDRTMTPGDLAALKTQHPLSEYFSKKPLRYSQFYTDVKTRLPDDATNLIQGLSSGTPTQPKQESNDDATNTGPSLS